MECAHSRGTRPLLEMLEQRLLLDGTLIDSPIDAAQAQALQDGLSGLADWAGSLGGYSHVSAVLPLIGQSIGADLDPGAPTSWSPG